jgi:2',3'-cyclic-nucleotide 2'-phosphodiesterase (5'-nucleotidase family)
MRKVTVGLALGAVLLLGAASVASGGSSTAGAAKKGGPAAPVSLQILTVSDWHGQLEPISGVGGAAVISSYWKADRLANPNTLTFTAGDAYGAAPPTSSFFDEAPAVRALRMMGVQADTFGNHNFDKGVAHLQRMIDLAKSPQEQGGKFRYIVSNLDNLEANLDGVKAFEFFEVAGVQVAVIGAMNEEAPELVRPGSLGTLEILNAASSVNHWARVVRSAGADVVVVLTHKGVRGFTAGQPFGELIDLANAVEGVDVILGDHTDIQYSGVHNGALVVEARSKGLTYAKTQLTVTPGAGVTAKSASFVTPLASAVAPDPAIQAMIDQLKTDLKPILGTVIGTSSVEILRSDSCGRADGRLCESKVGNQTTDALRFTYGTDFAITNSGGLRNALTCPPAGGGDGLCPAFTPAPWLITRGQVLAVLPFGNVAATLTVNGAELKQYLENGVSSMPGANGRFPQVSGLCFSYDIAALAGSRVGIVNRQAADGSCTGGPVDLSAAASYSLATNDFVAAGGDGYPNLISRATTREILDAVLADYVTAGSPISPAVTGRIVCTDANGAATAPSCPVQVP